MFMEIAIGAIGIGRAFNYGGFRNNPIYIPDEKPEGKSKSTIGHFYDKLLKLTKLQPFDAIITKGNVRYLRPTLFDLLANRALGYFENDERNN